MRLSMLFPAQQSAAAIRCRCRSCVGPCRAEKGVAVEEVEAAEEDGVVLPSRVKLTREERRKARSRGAHHGLPDATANVVLHMG